MANIFLYGAGTHVFDIVKEIGDDATILGIIDSNPKMWGQKMGNIEIVGNIEKVISKEYDEIVICTLQFESVFDFLLSKGIKKEKINTEYVRVYAKARELFVKDWAELLKDVSIKFAVAEGGVYKGDFAKIINEAFPDKQLLLFDTFEGFDSRDIKVDENEGFSAAKSRNKFMDTTEELVKGKMGYPDRVSIYAGYFPDTTENVPEYKYGFVNLDFDLYQPTLSGLRYFYPRMIPGGIILIHDYFTNTFNGVKQAIEDFKKEKQGHLITFPIGDHISIAVLKNEGL